MNTHLVSTFKLGFRFVRLFVETESENGSVIFLPADSGSARVTIGVNCSWGTAVSVLLHELYEATLIDLNTRYGLDPAYSNEASDFMFLVSHNQLSEAHERVGYALAAVLPDFTKVYKKYSPYKKG